MRRIARGFTLVEVMVTVVIVGILTAVALPSYNAYMVRARVAEAFSTLGGVQIAAEQHWANERKYTGLAIPAATTNFTYEVAADVSTYLVTARGGGPVAGFTYTINHAGARATPGVPPTGGWTGSTSCWVDRKGGACTQ